MAHNDCARPVDRLVEVRSRKSTPGQNKYFCGNLQIITGVCETVCVDSKAQIGPETKCLRIRLRKFRHAQEWRPFHLGAELNKLLYRYLAIRMARTLIASKEEA